MSSYRESLAIAPLCLRFLSCLTQTFFASAERSLNHRLPINNKKIFSVFLCYSVALCSVPSAGSVLLHPCDGGYLGGVFVAAAGEIDKEQMLWAVFFSELAGQSQGVGTF